MDFVKAFLVGGALCAVGQLLIDYTKLTPARILVSYVVAGVVLGGLGWYQPLIEFAGAGATVAADRVRSARLWRPEGGYRTGPHRHFFRRVDGGGGRGHGGGGVRAHRRGDFQAEVEVERGTRRAANSLPKTGLPRPVSRGWCGHPTPRRTAGPGPARVLAESRDRVSGPSK